MFVDLKPFAQAESVLHLLSYCLASVDSETLNSIADFYHHKEGLMLLGYLHNGTLIGVLGYTFKSPRKAIITHLSVAPEFRHRGIAKALIYELIHWNGLKSISAESTQEALEFYERLKFRCELKGDFEAHGKHYSCHLVIHEQPNHTDFSTFFSAGLF